MTLCRKCQKVLPKQTGVGRPRVLCDQCGRRGPAPIVKPVTLVPSAKLANVPQGRLVAATRAKLVETGREATPEGVAAVLAAEQLDNGTLTGTQYASLLKAWLATMDAATKGLTGTSSALDELRKRRDRRRSG